MPAAAAATFSLPAMMQRGSAMELLYDPQVWLAFATLTALEIVLGIDNIIFIAILASRLPVHQQQRARTIGLSIAMLTRIALLLSLTWIMRLTEPLFAVFGEEIPGRDLILLVGGLFLLAKSTIEIHKTMEGNSEHATGGAAAGSAHTQRLHLLCPGLCRGGRDV